MNYRNIPCALLCGDLFQGNGRCLSGWKTEVSFAMIFLSTIDANPMLYRPPGARPFRPINTCLKSDLIKQQIQRLSSFGFWPGKCLDLGGSQVVPQQNVILRMRVSGEIPSVVFVTSVWHRKFPCHYASTYATSEINRKPNSDFGQGKGRLSFCSRFYELFNDLTVHSSF